MSFPTQFILISDPSTLTQTAVTDMHINCWFVIGYTGNKVLFCQSLTYIYFYKLFFVTFKIQFNNYREGIYKLWFPPTLSEAMINRDKSKI